MLSVLDGLSLLRCMKMATNTEIFSARHQDKSRMLVLLLRRKYGHPYVDVYSRKGRDSDHGIRHLDHRTTLFSSGRVCALRDAYEMGVRGIVL